MIFLKEGSIKRNQFSTTIKFQTMKWIQYLFILFLLLGFPLFQMDQVIDTDWLVCENSIVIKSEYNDSSIDKNFCCDSKKVMFSFFKKIRLPFQLKNPLSALFSYFHGTSPFWRPPPGLQNLV